MDFWVGFFLGAFFGVLVPCLLCLMIVGYAEWNLRRKGLE